MRDHPQSMGPAAREHVRIAFIELDYHSEVLGKAAEIFERPGLDVSFLTRAAIAEQAGARTDSDPARWLLAKPYEPASVFLRRHWDLLQSQDAVILNTLASNMWLFAALPLKPPLYLRVHNVGSTFSPQRFLSLPRTPLFIWKAISHCVRRELFRLDWLARRLVLRRAEGVLFPSDSMMKSAEELGSVPPHLVRVLLPLAAYDPEREPPSPPTSDGPIFCIPGSIDERRRDYSPVLDALEIVERDGGALTLCLLGRPVGRYGRDVVQRARALARGGVRVVAFDGFVEMDEFDRWLFGATALLAPMVRRTRVTLYRETYGSTKISGIETDAVRAGKPCILPEWYEPDFGLQSASRHYADGPTLAREWMRWMDPGYREEMERKAKQCCERLTSSQIVPRFLQELGLGENRDD